MTGEPLTYPELYARAISANAPRSPIWGPSIGYRSIEWTASWVDASISARTTRKPRNESSVTP